MLECKEDEQQTSLGLEPTTFYAERRQCWLNTQQRRNASPLLRKYIFKDIPSHQEALIASHSGIYFPRGTSPAQSPYHIIGVQLKQEQQEVHRGSRAIVRERRQLLSEQHRYEISHSFSQFFCRCVAPAPASAAPSRSATATWRRARWCPACPARTW